MLAHQNPNLTEEIKRVRRPLDAWRRAGRTPRQIPQGVWDQAVDLAATHGVGPVAKGLGLDHSALKAKLAKHTPPGAVEISAPTFLEFFPAAPTSRQLDRCSMEVESSRGGRLRVELGGLDVSGLVSLLREFSA